MEKTRQRVCSFEVRMSLKLTAKQAGVDQACYLC